MSAGAGESARDRALTYLERRGWPGALLVELQGDASTRCYFRAVLSARTEVLLVEAPGEEKRLEPFLANAAFLEEQGLAPPRVLDHAADLGIVSLEDLGDVSLRGALAFATSAATRQALFAAALTALVRLQTSATAALHEGVAAFHVRFDEAVFLRELHMFAERYLRDLAGVKLRGGAVKPFEESLLWIARRLAAAPAVLTHRDYHIDNLFVTEGRLRLIDFQDARFGPASYDPASLLNDRDVHRFLEPADGERLLERFVATRGLDPDAFRSEYRLAVVQRGLKAVGTFADQAQRRGRKHYLEFISPTLDRVRAAAAGIEELRPILRTLDKATS